MVLVGLACRLRVITAAGQPEGLFLFHLAHIKQRCVLATYLIIDSSTNMSISLGRILDHGSAKASPMISEMVDETVNDFDNSHPGRAAERSDQKDMYRMGKKQELKVIAHCHH